MTRFRPGAPSPALAVSIVALIVALGGTSYAAFTLPANTVGTRQLKSGAVTTSKIKDGAVTGAKMNFAGVVVPMANRARQASNAASVSGEMVKKFFFASASATTPLQIVAKLATFTLRARCDAGRPDLGLTSSVGNWGLGGAEWDGAALNDLGSSNIGARVKEKLTAGANTGAGFLTASTPNGHNVSINYQVDFAPTLGSNACVATGTAIGS
jgi:hypothetical protein